MWVYDYDLKKTVEQIDEEDAIRLLIKHSPEFKRFYNEERIEKLGSILWRIDLDLGSPCQMKSITKLACGINQPIIYVYSVPIPVEYAFIAAHEIMHCILTEEGKSPIILGRICELATGLQTMFEDPIVDRILQNSYGFDVLKQYKKDLEFQREEFKKEQIEPKEKRAQVYIAFHISKHRLRWNMIKDPNAINDWLALLEDYKHYYPNVFIISDDILAIMQETDGEEMIDKLKSSFQKITEKYGLKELLIIGSPTEIS